MLYSRIINHTLVTEMYYCSILIEFSRRIDNKIQFVGVYLAEVFEDNSYVHVDNNKEGDDEIRDQVDNGKRRISTVTIGSLL